MKSNTYFPQWTRPKGSSVMPDETLPAWKTVAIGMQHVVTMFGSAMLAPMLMGFDPNMSIMFSGVATLLFFIITGGRLPSYLGSSFSYIGVVIAATAYTGSGLNSNIPVALGGIIISGALFALIGVILHFIGTNWIEKMMPPVVTGAVVASIGLSLSLTAVNMASANAYAKWIAVFSVVAVAIISVYGKGMIRQVPVLIGAGMAYVLYALTASSNGAPAIDIAAVAAAPWFGMPTFVSPVFQADAISMITPVVIILIAENLGHFKAIGAMTGRNLDALVGRGFIGNGVSTVVSGFFGGTAVTTTAENMGVMAITRVYSTLIFLVAGIFSILLGFTPKFGAIIMSIPSPILGGLVIVVFGLIAATAGRIWVDNKVDFSDTRNLITVGVACILGAGDFKLDIFGIHITGIGTGALGAILLYHILSLGSARHKAG